MPAQTRTSGLFAKYGQRLKQAIDKCKDKPVNYGFQRLPPGITNGVAKLVECTFGQVDQGKQNAGEYYFRAAGVVVSPKSVMHDGNQVHVQGAQTSVFYMLADSKDSLGNVTRSFDDNVERIANELKLLGGEDMDVSDLEQAAAALKAVALDPAGEGLYFKFSTSAGKSSLDPKTGKPRPPMVFENWHGTKGLEDYVPPDAAAGAVVDDTLGLSGARPSANGTAHTEPEGIEVPTQFDEFSDLDGLVTRAVAEDTAAQEELRQLAMNAGHSEADVDEAAGWPEVADLARNPVQYGVPEAVAEEPAPEPEPWKPAKGGVCKFTPVDPKTKKPAVNPRTKKPVAAECEITSVDAKSKTATLLSLVDRKTTYAKVPLAQLEPA